MIPVIIINCGMGNIASIYNMINLIGGKAQISTSPSVVKQSTNLILPGVGAFDAGIRALRETGMDAAIHEAVTDNGATLLGICLGMQLLMDSSEEGQLPGLGLVPGRVKRFQVHEQGLRVPHMGWNTVQPTRSSGLFDQSINEHRFYFVHSYHVECDEPEDIAGITRYGYDFTSAFEHDNICGVQFHPEKSHKFGMRLFKRFLGV
ncbi:imidazole glycerol phosphate synthase subunit HisH [Methanocalculus sp. MC3]